VHPTDRRLSQPGGLAARLYRLRREVAGLRTQAELASRLGWDRTKISKIESGKQLPSEDEIRAWAAACGRPGDAAGLIDLRTDIQAVHRTWRGRLRGGGAAVQDEYDRRIRAAKRMRAVSPLVVPGLLQTESYARAIVAGSAEIWGLTDVDATVEARMRRRDVLYTDRTFELVTTEAALRMPPCPPQVMRGQLDRLMSLDLPNVTLGIIPLGVQLPLVPQNNFMLADDVATVEAHGGEDTLGERESAVYVQVFDRLMGVAVTGEEARRLITAAAAALRETEA
jgi:transcriptional regulator with XRE-family HTH domain